ncbi:hypothetical protein JL100_015100 [Skermanella mucosa]|uniref:hypothetical protein n=1 Tax=Skermanella mucosa TaxID=1789672 RepID=UPI00192C38EA|nr:hypothetical protein [Skermanella mucosa]UEM18452.1 hypothetical protein JL100_015100 [Skermanella mucosa]
MPRANQPSLTRQLTLFPPSCPGPDRTSLPKETLDKAARLMARMLMKEAAGNAAGGARGECDDD